MRSFALPLFALLAVGCAAGASDASEKSNQDLSTDYYNPDPSDATNVFNASICSAAGLTPAAATALLAGASSLTLGNFGISGRARSVAADGTKGAWHAIAWDDGLGNGTLSLATKSGSSDVFVELLSAKTAVNVYGRMLSQASAECGALRDDGSLGCTSYAYTAISNSGAPYRATALPSYMTNMMTGAIDVHCARLTADSLEVDNSAPGAWIEQQVVLYSKF